MHGDFGAGWWIPMAVMMALFWGAVIFGILWFVRGGFDGWRAGRRETPLDVLERRFAEGAISVEDYHERRDVLETGAPGRPRSSGEAGSSAPQASRTVEQ
jgi:putative membrane protein